LLSIFSTRHDDVTLYVSKWVLLVVLLVGAAGWKIINLNFILQPSTIFPPGCAQQLAGLYAFSFFLKKK
jgi:hypothetical protein